MVFVIVSIIVTAIGGIYTLLKIVREIKKAHKIDNDNLLQEAKELDDVVKNKLESRMKLLESQLTNLEHSVAKDLINIKDNHAIELKNLSERIELLRTDLNLQHSQIINLLTKLIN